MKEFIIATTSMFVISAGLPKDTSKPAPQQKKITKKATEKKAEDSDDSIFTLFNLTFKFQ